MHKRNLSRNVVDFGAYTTLPSILKEEEKTIKIGHKLSLFCIILFVSSIETVLYYDINTIMSSISRRQKCHK